jgi:DNA polymerase III alpha subunit (gram-positive type)
MLYCSLDIETTGLNPKTCDIIQFAAVLDDLSNPQPLEKLPRFNTFFTKSTYQGYAPWYLEQDRYGATEED